MKFIRKAHKLPTPQAAKQISLVDDLNSWISEKTSKKVTKKGKAEESDDEESSEEEPLPPAPKRTSHTADGNANKKIRVEEDHATMPPVYVAVLLNRRTYCFYFPPIGTEVQALIEGGDTLVLTYKSTLSQNVVDVIARRIGEASDSLIATPFSDAIHGERRIPLSEPVYDHQDIHHKPEDKFVLISWPWHVCYSPIVTDSPHIRKTGRQAQLADHLQQRTPTVLDRPGSPKQKKGNKFKDPNHVPPGFRANQHEPVMYNIPVPKQDHSNRLKLDKLISLQTTSTAPAEVKEPDLTNVPSQYLQYKSVFSEGVRTLPAHSQHDLEIDTNGATPPWGPPHEYNLSESELKVVHDYLQDMLSRGFICPSKAPCGAPILFVKKKDGGLRLCVDYRKLNNLTVKNVYPLPLIAELLDRFAGAKIFTKLDLKDAYWHLRIKEGHEWKTAFRTRYGLFEYLIVPFGLSNAPGNWQAYVNDKFTDILDCFVVIYLDDFLIFSKNETDHQKHVEEVLRRLQEHKLAVNAKKCEWHKSSVDFLGYIVSADGIGMCPDRVQAIRNWQVPKNVSDLRSFLGFTNFYRGFIPKYSDITVDLTTLFKKDQPWNWTMHCQQAFDIRKSTFESAQIIRHFDPSLPLTLETDALDFAISGILTQPYEDGSHPIAFYSRKLQPAELNYDVHDKELLAIIESLSAWRHWCQGTYKPLQIITDHKNLKYFMTTKELNRRQVRWAQFLADFNFTLEHRAGAQNGKADILSRRPQDAIPEGEKRTQHLVLPPEVFAPVKSDIFHRIATLNPVVHHIQFENSIRRAQLTDPFYKTTVQWMKDKKGSPYPPRYHRSKSTENENNEDTQEPNQSLAPQDELDPEGSLFRISNGLLYHKGLLYVPEELRTDVLITRHDSLTAGHWGVTKTIELIERDFWWPQLRRDVKDFISTCHTCIRTKPLRQKPSGLLQPLSIPSDRWSNVTLDFIVELPAVDGYNAILVVVDRFTKMAHFIPTVTTVTSQDTAKLFIDNVWKLHALQHLLCQTEDHSLLPSSGRIFGQS
ncbi:retrotransposable element protein [Planoprotostelium fungivorum]|uniref:Retrotransposable element protein n=1 Tax=Planoprotostelium fungivorum TaxID=1890364 RepID=A0A2P6N659_9EUKA|nr:retrotransposable element protein [Planoprotostelium fungivorum]